MSLFKCIYFIRSSHTRLDFAIYFASSYFPILDFSVATLPYIL